MKEVEIYTDGACSYNPGPGGYCAILSYANKEKIISGGEENTTNNRMELIAVIVALKALKEECKVDLYSDSAYVCNAINEKWLITWQFNNWRTASKKEVQNKDLWQELLQLLSIHKVIFHKVKGHSDNEKNNRCDEVARMVIQKILKNNKKDTK